MKVKKLLPLLLLLTFITLFGCAASEANSNGKSVEANENETETKDIKSDNLDKAEKLTEASSLRAEANSALKNAGDASQNENSHEAYARHYYEVRNYTVNHISITKESDRNLYDVEVYVDAPYGECVFTHRITPEELENNFWWDTHWEPDYITYNPEAESFLGRWYYNGQTANISIMIHKIDLSQKKIAYEYSCDCDYVSKTKYSSGSRGHFTGESDRVVTSDLIVKEDGYYFEIENVEVYLDPVLGVKTSLITLSQSGDYNKIKPYLPASRILGDDTPMYLEDKDLTGDNARHSYKSPYSEFNWKGLANNDGDGTRIKQTYFIWGSYQSLCGTAYISGQESLPEHFDKSAEIYIYGDGKLLKTITDKEVKEADYELYFEVNVSNVKELTFDMPGELLYEKDRGWGVDRALLNLGNLIVSKHDTYCATQFSYSNEGALEFQGIDKADEYMLSCYSFFEETGFRPVFVAVTYDKRFYELNDNFEYDLNEQEVRKYAKDVFDDVTEPGTNSFLIIYFSDGVEPDREVVDRYFYFYSPNNEKAIEKIKAWFLETRGKNANWLSDRVIATLHNNRVMYLDL